MDFSKGWIGGLTGVRARHEGREAAHVAVEALEAHGADVCAQSEQVFARPWHASQRCADSQGRAR